LLNEADQPDSDVKNYIINLQKLIYDQNARNKELTDSIEELKKQQDVKLFKRERGRSF